MTKLIPALFAVLIAAAANFGLWGWFNRPVPVELSFDEQFPSVSFAPFRRGQSPLSRDYPPPEQIEADLKSLVGVARGVRTYTSQEGLEIVPELARKYGLEVTHSAWLGVKLDNNEKEVRGLIRAANTYPDTIKRVIVGNEVLLRRDLSPEQLIKYIRRVKAEVKQPVSYADVWAFWLKHPELAREVDYITVHILPYWEDEPVGIEDAGEHLVKIYRMVQEAFPGKPILIGESGWPTRGRSRGPAEASMENGARFVRELARISKENGFDYNVVEAFDQPWKAMLEGTVGAEWGVLDANRDVKFTMHGPVEPSPHWRLHAAVAVALGALCALAALLRPAGRYGLAAVLAVAVMGQVLGSFAVWQAINAIRLSFSLWGDVWALPRMVIHGAFTLLLFRLTAQSLAKDAVEPFERWAERLAGFYALCAVSATLLLFFNGRYRDIPSVEFLTPAYGVLLFGLVRMVRFKLSPIDALALGRVFAGDKEGGFAPAKPVFLGLMGAAILSPLSDVVALARGEDFVAMHPDFSQQVPLLAQAMLHNTQLLAWSLTLVVLALPFLAEWLRQRRAA